MYQHCISCSLDSISFSCDYDQVNILSATYGTVSTAQQAVVSDLCDRNAFNATFLELVGHSMHSLELHQQCDITAELQAYYKQISTSTTNIDLYGKLIESNPNCTHSHNNDTAPMSHLYEISYFCPPPAIHLDDVDTETASDSELDSLDLTQLIFLFDAHSGATTVDLSSFIRTKLVNPHNPSSTYYLCLIIMCILCMLLLCGCYQCCVQCLRCYQYRYCLCHCSCCHSLIQRVCCCTLCNEYTWFYYTKPTGDDDDDEEHGLRRSNLAKRKMGFKDVPSGISMNSMEYANSCNEHSLKPQAQHTDRDQMHKESSRDTQGTLSPFYNNSNMNNKFKYKDRHRISVPSTTSSRFQGSFNRNKAAMFAVGSHGEMQHSADTTPIPEENAVDLSAIDVLFPSCADFPAADSVGTPSNLSKPRIKIYEHRQKQQTNGNSNNNQNHNSDALPPPGRLTFRSPASIELSPLSQTSHITHSMYPGHGAKNAENIARPNTHQHVLAMHAHQQVSTFMHDIDRECDMDMDQVAEDDDERAMAEYPDSNPQIGNYHSLPVNEQEKQLKPKLLHKHQSSPNVIRSAAVYHHPAPQDNITQSVTDMPTMTIDEEQDESQDVAVHLNSELILPSDGSNSDNNVNHNDEQLDEAKANANDHDNDQDSKAATNKQYNVRQAKREQHEAENMPPMSTRMVFGSKSNTKHDIAYLMQQDIELTYGADTSMTNVVMLNYDSSPEMKMDDVINDAVDDDKSSQRGHGMMVMMMSSMMEKPGARKSGHSMAKLPEILTNLSNKASNKFAATTARPSTPKRLKMKLKALKSKSHGVGTKYSHNENEDSNVTVSTADTKKNKSARPNTERVYSKFFKHDNANSSTHDANKQALPALRDENSSNAHSPLKLVKAATWNGRRSEIIELFDVHAQNNSFQPHPSKLPEDGNKKHGETVVGLYENNSGHILSLSLEQCPLASELKTIKEISQEHENNDIEDKHKLRRKRTNEISTPSALRNMDKDDDDDAYLHEDDKFESVSKFPRVPSQERWRTRSRRVLTDTEDMTDADAEDQSLMDSCMYSNDDDEEDDDAVNARLNHSESNSESKEENVSRNNDNNASCIWRDELSAFTSYIAFDDLQFLQYIGRGAHSKVYQGEWKEASVCIKMYDENYSFKKIRHEIEMFCRVGNHPHILPIYGYTYDSKHGTFALIAQWMSHGSAAYAANKQSLNIVPTLLMLKYACCGLLHLHEKGVLHGHFAARHILLDMSGKCCITNLGECVDELKNNMHGRPQYANITATTPPEVMTNKIYTKKSDVYAFGIACWQILTREVPFQGLKPIDAQIKIVKENKRPPQLNIPDDIYMLLTKCWHLQPENRPDLDEIISDFNDKLRKYRLLSKGRLPLQRSNGMSSVSSMQAASSIYSAPTQLQALPSNSSTSQAMYKRPSLVPVKYGVSAPYPGQTNVIQHRYSTSNINIRTMSISDNSHSKPSNHNNSVNRRNSHTEHDSNNNPFAVPSIPNNYALPQYTPISHPQLQHFYTYSASPQMPSEVHRTSQTPQPPSSHPNTISPSSHKNASAPNHETASDNYGHNRNRAASPLLSHSHSDQRSYNASQTPSMPLYSRSEYGVSSMSGISPNAAQKPISPPPSNYNVTSPEQMAQIIRNGSNIVLENINSQSIKE